MGKKIKEFSEATISAFLHCYRVTDVCKEAGISRSTAYKLLKNPDFQKILNERKARMVEAAVGEMRDCFSKNIRVLQDVIEDNSTPQQTKVYAISTYLSQMKNWVEVADILGRLQKLEESVETDLDKKKS